MAVHLLVREPFGDYAKGDVIADPALVAAIRDGHESAYVTPFTAPDAAPVAAAPAPAAETLAEEATALAHEADQVAAEANHEAGA